MLVISVVIDFQLVQHINNVHILKESAQLLGVKEDVISYEKKRPQYPKLSIADRIIIHNIISFFNKGENNALA